MLPPHVDIADAQLRPLGRVDFLFYFLRRRRRHLDHVSFPTRRSSDLPGGRRRAEQYARPCKQANCPSRSVEEAADRKSTRLNSSHQIISYAVFCLKKKKCQ